MRLATAAAHRYSPLEDVSGLDALGADLESDLVRDIADWIAGLPRPGPRLAKEFSADTPAKARIAAVTWLQDLQQHEPLDLESIRTTVRGGEYAATVTYRLLEKIDLGAQPAEPSAPADRKDVRPPQDLATGACAVPPHLAPPRPAARQTPVAPKLPRVALLQLPGADG